MKKCNYCNIDMIENIEVTGQHPFEVGTKGKSKIFINIPTGKKSSVLGLTIDETIKTELMACVCPNCGKVEMYINTNK